MKKKLFVWTVGASLVLCSLFVVKAFADVYSGTGSWIDPNTGVKYDNSGHCNYGTNYPYNNPNNGTPNIDTTNFPYGFLCGSSNQDQKNTNIGRPGTNDNLGSHDTTGSSGNAIQLSAQTSVNIKLGFKRDRIAQKRDASGNLVPAGVLVWAYVLPDSGDESVLKVPSNTGNWITADLTNITGPGSQPSTQCPGDGSFYPAVDTYKASGPDKSPLADTGGSVNCHDRGLMAYWRVPASTIASTNDFTDAFGFTVHLNPAKDNKYFCVREEISVIYDGDPAKDFPTNSNPDSQSTNASHLAKQSNRVCYKVAPPRGSMTLSCSSTSPNAHYSLNSHYLDVDGTAADESTSPVQYQIAHKSNGSFVIDVDPGTSQYAYGSGAGPPATGDFIGVSGRTYYLLTKTMDSSDYVQAVSGSTLNPVQATLSCNPPPAPPSYSSSMNCNLVHISDLYDPNDSGSGVHYAVNIFHQNADGSKGDWATGGGRNAHFEGRNADDFDIPFQNNITEENFPDHNYGYIAEIGVYDANNDGSDGAFGYFQVIHTAVGVPCYQAACSVSVNGIYGTNDSVEAGKPFTVNAAIINTGPDGYYKNPLPENVMEPSGAVSHLSASMQPSGDFGTSAVTEHTVNSDVFIGGSAGTSWSLNAPAAIGTYTINVYPDYYGHGPIGRSCPFTVKVYQPYEIAPDVSTGVVGSVEDPSAITYYAASKLAYGPSVQTGVFAKFYELPASGGRIDRAVNSDDGPWTTTPFQLLNGTYVVPKPVVPGTQYCTEALATNWKGFRGPGGPTDLLVDPANSSKLFTSNCPKIVNVPYFKTFGAGISSGGDYAATNASCNSPGVLASWNNNSGQQPDFGASSSLNTVALSKIIGVASNQSAFNNDATKLSFANNGGGVDTTGGDRTYSPALGGNYTTTHCITAYADPVESGSPTLSTYISPIDGKQHNLVPLGLMTSGSYSFTGDLVLDSGGVIPAGKNIAIYVSGNIYISSSNGGIKYQGPWTAATVPSFVLNATGNIYIDNDVSQLDGLYAAQTKTDGTAGKIFTCADGFQPIISNQYPRCSKQLLINGSFTAQQVNLGRTYGSQRDERPKGAFSSSDTLSWSHSDVGNCVEITELYDIYWGGTIDRDGGPVRPAAAHNWLCTNNPAIQFSYNYSYRGTHPASTPYCTAAWDVPWEPSATATSTVGSTYWGDNVLCASVPLVFSVSGLPAGTSAADCTKISVTSEGHGAAQWNNAYVCFGSNVFTPPTPLQPCSNPGSSVVGNTCAAEVFQFTPELYLADPKIRHINNGAIQYDAITSLPPVL